MQLNLASVVESLLEDKPDDGECWLSASVPNCQTRAAAAGATIVRLEYSKFNLDIYGNGLVTSLDPAITLAQVNDIIGLIGGKATLGQFEEEKIARTLEILRTASDLDSE